MPTRHYTAQDGNEYPLTEARYDMMFKVFKSDRRKCTPSDPHNCLLARGIMRHPDVLDVYVGSGLDAYVVFKETEDDPAHAVHFGIRTKIRRIIDAFDKDKKTQSVDIILCKPPHSWRLDYRRAANSRRRKEVKEGSPVKKRKQPTNSVRVSRFGTGRRPAAQVSKSGNVEITPAA